MLEPLLGSQTEERVLVYLYGLGEGYPRQMARFWNAPFSPVQKQLQRLEAGGIIYSRQVGRTRLYRFSPRYAFLKELKALLEKALTFYPKDQRRALLVSRRRPRMAGKPL